MSKEGNSRREDQIAALHAAVLALGGIIADDVRPGTSWVFASQTAEGSWLFTYVTQEDSPGEGWKKITGERIGNVSGGEGYVRVEP